MTGNWLGLAALLALVFLAGELRAQTFSAKPEEFFVQMRERLSKHKTPYIVEFNKRFSSEWNAGNLSLGAQERAVKQLNKLSAQGWLLAPDLIDYMQTLFTVVSPGSQIKIRDMDFFAVTDSCIQHYPKDRVKGYLKQIEQFVPKGMVYETGIYGWQLREPSPRFTFLKDTTRGAAFPAFSYSNTSLSFYGRKGNELAELGQIKNAQGYFDLFDRKFHGAKGRYDWSRTGLAADLIRAEFDAFKLDMTLVSFRIDTVTLNYPSFLPHSLKGSLEEYLQHWPKPEEALYPYFKSYEGGMKIANFVPNVDYEGGFSMRGVTKIGSRTDVQLATLMVKKKNGDPALRIAGESVVLNPIRMVMDDAAVTVLLPKQDSLYHPSMQLIYTVESQDILLYLDRKQKVARQPILNSYHKLHMYFDAIKWNPNRDTIEFSALVDKEHKLFAVESYDFFRDSRFRSFRGVMNYNPIDILYAYYVRVNFSDDKKKKKKTKEEEEAAATATASEAEWDWFFEGKPEPEKPVQEEVIEPPVEEPEPEKELVKIFWVNEVLTRMKLRKDKEKFEKALEELEGSGFIYLRENGHKIEIRESLINWGRASRGVKDYDVISITNQIEEGANAQLDLRKSVLQVFGVNSFMLSDSQYVECIPLEQTIFAYENRGLAFGGGIKAGKINLATRGKENYRFYYDDFKVVCDSIAFLTFSPERDPNPENRTEEAQQLAKGLQRLRLEGMSGTLYIDRPTSKSGLRSKPMYSAFDSHTPAYVYWDDKTVQKGVYHREKLYFQVDPFLIDSLGKFNMAALEFTGELYCPQITEVLRDTLKPVADKSYGLREQTPEDGREMYEGKGRFFNMLHLDQFGLHGQGAIEYRNTHAESDTFIFHFDSVMAVTKSFSLPESNIDGVDYPSIQVNRARYKWYPQKDLLVLQTIDEPIILHDGESAFFGTLYLTAAGVRAAGSLTIGQEQFIGDSIMIEPGRTNMITGTYQLTDQENSSKLHFEGKRMSAARDMRTGRTEFRSLDPAASNTRFAQQKFSTTLSKGHFESASKLIHIEQGQGDSLSRFAATDSSMQGLGFVARAADYTLDEEVLRIEGTDSILVADAVVFPANNKISILPTGAIDRLEGCRLLANRDNRMHEFGDANVQIISGVNYLADGRYKYIPVNDSTPQIIDFEDIYVKPDTVTYARTIIPEEQGFFITERFYFKDTVTLSAKDRFMSFAGQVRIQTANPALSEAWIPVNIPNANPDSIVVTIGKEQIGTKKVGVYGMSDRHGYYSLFLQNPINRRDEKKAIFEADGVITFDRTTKEFRIGPEKKLKKQQFRGNEVNYLEGSDSLQIMTSRGLFTFPTHFSSENPSEQSFSMRVSGEWKQNETRRTIKTDWVMALDFHPALKSAMEYMGVLFASIPSTDGDIRNVSSRNLLEYLAEFTDEKTPDERNIRALAEMATRENQPAIQTIDFAKHVPVSLLLSNVRFWYCDSSAPGTAGFLIADQPIGLVGVAGRSMNKLVRAKILYAVGSRSGGGNYRADKLKMYLEFSDDNVLYFEFDDNKMKVYTDKPALRDKFQAVAAKTMKKSGTSRAFSLTLATREIEVEEFLKQFGRIQRSGCGK